MSDQSAGTAAAGIVLLAADGMSTNILFNALERQHGLSGVIIEDRLGRRDFLLNRARRMGYREVAGQVLFQAMVPPILGRLSRHRIEEILRAYSLDPSPIPPNRVIRVKSANSPEARKALQNFTPDLVVINGTRILDAETLSAVDARFINIHAGITPLYRGVHGGYWALAASDPDHCGVTVHEVDTGVDTGRILRQEKIAVTRRDNFVTYPLLQLGAGIPLLLRHLSAGELSQSADDTVASRLWSHPTLWGYLRTLARSGVK